MIDEKLKKDIDNIVWWIPFKKTRNSLRKVIINYFECYYYINNDIQNIYKNTNIINELYRDNNYLCPICGYSGKEFLPFGVVKRKNAQCPNCKSLERHRLYYLYLLRKINADKKLKVCHFAPEKSIKDTFDLFKNIDYISCDIVPNRAMCVQDITSTTFEDNYFDIVFCSHVLEHIPDDIKAMKELRRILKPDGFAILQVPYFYNWKGEELKTTYEDFSITSPEEREKAFGQNDHVRVYTKEDYVNRLNKSGFNVYEDNFYYTLSDKAIKKYSLIEEVIFYCTKN
ncbi:type 11 methyltransferase [Brachyspira pilosicoli]|uniref:class I SAM-dependent methyltransferase n=1 Tax=Brachyspira pilosicoli TaxID=52584 RepID=UPI000E12A984|nr:class I SAM-dependent methyltransferase [Brachyspira pilosicoli]SUW09327.1 type 11 methyltransferase [Brachyspira pilosicoli]